MKSLLVAFEHMDFNGSSSTLVSARDVCWLRIHLLPVLTWLLERTLGSSQTGVSFGQNFNFSDLNFADNACMLAERLELLDPVLEVMAIEAASVGLEVNWQKTNQGSSSGQ